MLAQTHAPPPPPPSFYLRGGGGGQTGVYPVLPSQLQENMADMKLVSQLDGKSFIMTDSIINPVLQIVVTLLMILVQDLQRKSEYCYRVCTSLY